MLILGFLSINKLVHSKWTPLCFLKSELLRHQPQTADVQIAARDEHTSHRAFKDVSVDD